MSWIRKNSCDECHNDRTDILSDSETVGAYPSDYDDYDEQGCH